MALLYKRTTKGLSSSFWYMRFIHPETGKTASKSLKPLRWDNAEDTRKARSLEADLTAEELRMKANGTGHRWETWVPGILKQNYDHPGTRLAYEVSWGWLLSFFREQKIRGPEDLTYAHVKQFVAWRMDQGRAKNTALKDVKLLRILMREAVHFGWVQYNCVDRHGIKKTDPKEKPEWSQADLDIIFAALKGQPQWMTDALRIALHTGCRLSETRIDFRYIDFQRGSITFEKPKGGRHKAFTRELPKALVPRLKQIKATGAQFTVDLPRSASQLFSKFFSNIGKDWCFHCSRVSYINWLYDRGVDAETVKDLVNHASDSVHKIYKRRKLKSLGQFSNLKLFQEPAALRTSRPSAAKP